MDADYSFIDDYFRARDEVVPLHGWSHHPDDMWCYVRPPGSGSRSQGWKIHVSATPRHAVPVLTEVARILLRKRVSFKFAKGLRQLRQLLSIRCDRGSGGKFITIYSDNDEVFAELLPELHEATRDYEGPVILSDRPYQPGSLVHYRFGGFTGNQKILDLDGSYVPSLAAPNGDWVPDERNAWYSPPAWAPLPMPEADRFAGTSRGDKSKVKLADRFVVYEAIRHSNRGGVYRATDEQTGAKVIVKEARPFVAAEVDGSDARDYLRNEYETLRMLQPLGIATRPVDLFDYQGHIFLAEEEVPGETLRGWVEGMLKPLPRQVLPLADALPIARQLVDLMSAVHDKGFVFRDFTPNNVMVTDEKDLVLIDTEFMAVPGQQVNRVATMSYVAPEEAEGPPQYPAPDPTADLYSLGASLFYLVGGTHPLIPADEPAQAPDSAPAGPRRPHTERLDFLLAALGSTNATLRAFDPLVRGLMAEEPSARLSLPQVRELLDTIEQRPRATVDDGQPDEGQPDDNAELRALLDEAGERRMLEDGWAQTVDAMTPRGSNDLWPNYPMGEKLLDSFALQAGAAGPLDVLRQALRATGEQRYRDALAEGLNWLDVRLAREPRNLPGLYFGRSGALWSMYEAARELSDTEVMARTLSRAKQLPVVWNNPDITHGVSGSGLAQLHLLRHNESDEELRARIGLCADKALATRSGKDGMWPLPDDTPNNAGGLTHYGFAHGVAGICYFLLAAGRALGRDELLEHAIRGGDLLLSHAIPSGSGIKWPVAQKEAEAASLFEGVCWWCSGSPGIGTFLLRLWHATGEDGYLQAAKGAAVATREEMWLLSPCHCHGLAGNGEFLLDMAAATGEAQYLRWAREHAVALFRLASIRDGRLLVLDDSASMVSYSYNIGLAGPLSFLNRLRNGGERSWMVDEFTLRPESVG